MNVADRVQETSSTTGTGNITLAGAATNCRAFSAAYSVNDTRIPYAIVHQTLSEWEVGYGTYSAANTLTRTFPLRGTSGTRTLVNFSAGTKDVFVDIPADLIADFVGRGRLEQARLGAFSI